MAAAVVVSKTVSYSVLAPKDSVAVSKTVAYSMMKANEASVAVAKTVAYSVFGDPLPTGPTSTPYVLVMACM